MCDDEAMEMVRFAVISSFESDQIRWVKFSRPSISAALLKEDLILEVKNKEAVALRAQTIKAKTCWSDQTDTYRRSGTPPPLRVWPRA